MKAHSRIILTDLITHMKAFTLAFSDFFSYPRYEHTFSWILMVCVMSLGGGDPPLPQKSPQPWQLSCECVTLANQSDALTQAAAPRGRLTTRRAGWRGGQKCVGRL